MDVIDVNILPTPSVGILVRELEAAGGIVLNSFNKEFPSATFDSTEGVKVLFEKAWILVRPSNTEPILRVVVEAQDPENAKQLLKRAMALLT